MEQLNNRLRTAEEAVARLARKVALLEAASAEGAKAARGLADALTGTRRDALNLAACCNANVAAVIGLSVGRDPLQVFEVARRVMQKNAPSDYSAELWDGMAEALRLQLGRQ